MKRLIATIVLLLAPASAHAQPVDCAKATSTAEMNACAEQDFIAADKSLNIAYAAALAYVKGRDVEKPYDAKSFEAALRESQRAWIAFRDADCKNLVAQEWSGGSGTASASLGCMTDLTTQRAKDLKERYEER